jgi:hypothetical protein
MGKIGEERERQRLAELFARLEEGELKEIAGDGGGSLWKNASGAGTQRAMDRE